MDCAFLLFWPIADPLIADPLIADSLIGSLAR
jgi:hypothetical protein